MTDVMDYSGIQEFFADCIGEIEDVGNGLVRVVYCVDHHGIMTPTVSVVRPAASVLQLMPALRELAERIMCRDGEACRN